MLTPRSLVVLVGCLLSQAASAYTLTCSISNVDSSTFKTGDVTLTLTNNTGLGAIQPGKTIEVRIDSVNGALIASVCSDKLLGRSNVYKLEGVIGADSKFGLRVGPCYTKVLTSNAACTADPARPAAAGAGRVVGVLLLAAALVGSQDAFAQAPVVMCARVPGSVHVGDDLDLPGPNNLLFDLLLKRTSGALPADRLVTITQVGGGELWTACTDEFSFGTFLRVYDVGFSAFASPQCVAAVTEEACPVPPPQPGPMLVVGVDQAASPLVRAFDGDTLALVSSNEPFTAGLPGGVRVAAGDLTGDGLDDLVVGAGPLGSSEVQVFDGVSGALVRAFAPYSAPASVFVAAGDVTGDGIADIVTGPDTGLSETVKVFDGATNMLVWSFLPFGPGYLDGIRVAAGDLDGDGRADIVVGSGPGAAPTVKAYDGTSLSQLKGFFPFDPLNLSYHDGIWVAAGDLDADGLADIVVGAGPGAPPEVHVFSGATNAVLASFDAYDPSFAGGVRVAVRTDGANADIVTGTGPGGAEVRTFDGTTASLIGVLAPFDAGVTDGVFVAAGVFAP